MKYNNFIKKCFLLIGFLSSIIMTSCHFVSSFKDSPSDDTTISFASSSCELAIGEMDAVALTISADQNSKTVSWSYDSTIINATVDNYGIVITGLQAGNTSVKASLSNGATATCYVTVTADSYTATVTNPYVYCSSDFIEVKPNGVVKVSASLYGGTAGDTSGFSWSIDKSSVASLYTEGNYCWITGANEGMAKISVRHSKAAFPYTILVSCTSDGTSASYITTDDNIVTINLSESSSSQISVDLKNPETESYEFGFTYSVVDELGNEITGQNPPITISGAEGRSVNIQAYYTGECYIHCSHPSAAYSLDILVRIVEDTDISYIDVSEPVVTLSGTSSQILSASLVNYSGEEDELSYSWDFSSEADEICSWTISGNKVTLAGIKTGSTKVTCSYPGFKSRSVIILVRDLTTEAASATTYITTSQNYIRMEPDGDPVQVNITITDCAVGDKNSLKWSIVNCPNDGSSKVISWDSGNGSSSSKISARSVVSDTLSYSETAYGIISPISPGTAYIDITHPKAIYPTRITVVVSETSSSQNPVAYLALSSSPRIELLNGSNTTVSVSYTGDGSSNDILWSSSNDSVTVSGNGSECVITAPDSGSGLVISTVTASHSYANYPVTYSVICYDTEEELESVSLKNIWSTYTSRDLYIGNETNLSLSYDGFGDESPNITWSCSDTSILSLESTDDSTSINALALGAGNVTVTASCDGCQDVVFSITVNNPSVVDATKDCYLSTSSNVLYFDSTDSYQTINITANNISSIAYSDIVWTCDSDAFDIISTGNSASVCALSSNASGTLTVTHPLSKNTLTIYLKSGSQYEYVNTDVCYITTDVTTLNLYAGANEVSFVAKLNHTAKDETELDSSKFEFISSDESVATATYVIGTNICYVNPLKQGTCYITVANSSADYTAEIPVIVDKAPDADSIPYITTTQNVVTMVAGDYTTLSAELKNSNAIDVSYWHWTSLDSKVCDVVGNNGATAMISANQAGTTKIQLIHDKCDFKLEFIVTVLDAAAISSTSYISTSTSIVSLCVGENTTVSAEMLGDVISGAEKYLKWSISDSSIALVNPSNESCYIKALNSGITYISVSNSKYSSSYSRTILVVVNDSAKEGIYISTDISILKMKPSDTGSTVTATLVNGEPTDAQDFIWWADDYNIVNITSLTDTCVITPAGLSGTTKVHVKHSKASKQVDIIVLVSNYDTFAFSQTSAYITAEKLYFFALQVPAIDDDYSVTYSSSDDDVCSVYGSNAVATICGKKEGVANITATMKSSSGAELATAEMLVSVSVASVTEPVISLGNVILTVEEGSSQTISATISGDTLVGGEEYTLKWEANGTQPKGISLIGNNDSLYKTKDDDELFVAYGNSVYLETEDIGEDAEFVVTVSLPGTNISSTLYIKLVTKGNIEISLSSYLETVYQDDGSFTLTATLTNANTEDYQNISWSAVKVGGINIISVSKTKGNTCTVTPRTQGQTTVIARLPNGKTATCTVIVKAAAQISFTTGTVHVIPGYTVAVPYTVTPENANISWYAVYTADSSLLENTSYFTFENDTANKQLLITGKKDYSGASAGYIQGIISGSGSDTPKLYVYCEYNVEVEIQDKNSNFLTVINNTWPDTANTKDFYVMYFPSDLVLDVSLDESIVQISDYTDETVYDEGIKKSLRKYTLQPKSEGECTITVTGTLPKDTSGTYSKAQSFSYSAYYSKYNITVHWLSEQTGSFTKYDSANKCLNLGDGESASFYITIDNENAAGSLQKIDTSTISSYAISNTGHKNEEFSFSTDSRLTSGNRDTIKGYLFNGYDDEGHYIQSYDNQEQCLQNYSSWPSLVKNGAMSLTSSTLDNGATIYTIAHNFDWYKDLPVVMENSVSYDLSKKDDWENYYDVYLTNHSEGDIISYLANKGVDNWLLVGVPYLLNGGTKYYPIGTSKTKKSGNFTFNITSQNIWVPGAKGYCDNWFTQHYKYAGFYDSYFSNWEWHYKYSNSAWSWWYNNLPAWQPYANTIESFYKGKPLENLDNAFVQHEISSGYDNSDSRHSSQAKYSGGKILKSFTINCNGTTIWTNKDKSLTADNITILDSNPIFSESDVNSFTVISTTDLKNSALYLKTMNGNTSKISSLQARYDSSAVTGLMKKGNVSAATPGKSFYTDGFWYNNGGGVYCFGGTYNPLEIEYTYSKFKSTLQATPNHVRPTICKDNKDVTIGNITIPILYKNKKGNTVEVNISVNVIKRNCEAYANSNWKNNYGTQWDYTGDLGKISVTPYTKVEEKEEVIETYEDGSDSNTSLSYTPKDVSNANVLTLNQEDFTFTLADSSGATLYSGTNTYSDDYTQLSFSYTSGESSVSETYNVTTSDDNSAVLTFASGTSDTGDNSTLMLYDFWGITSDSVTLISADS